MSEYEALQKTIEHLHLEMVKGLEKIDKTLSRWRADTIELSLKMDQAGIDRRELAKAISAYDEHEQLGIGS